MLRVMAVLLINVILITPLAWGGTPSEQGEKIASALGRLQNDFKERHFASVVSGATALLQSKAGAGEEMPRFEIAELKAEALLQLHQMPAAAQAFESAQAESRNLVQLETAYWTGRLIELSSDLHYTPLHDDAGALDIVEPSHRRLALAALLRDQLADAAAEHQKMLAATDLAMVWPAMQRDLYLAGSEKLESSADQASAAAPLDAESAAHCLMLMNDALDRSTAAIRQMQDHAVSADYSKKCGISGVVAQYGVSNADKISATKRQDLARSIEDAAQLARRLQAQDDRQWKALQIKARDQVHLAQVVLDDRYGGMTLPSASSMQRFNASGADFTNALPACGPDGRPAGWQTFSVEIGNASLKDNALDQPISR